jgi:methenyltetrahydromethanopterin cyclohydrolase
MVSINKIAASIAREAVQNKEALGIESYRLENGTVIIDMGVKVKGSMEAGLIYTRLTMGGLATVSFGEKIIKGYSFPSIDVFTHEPVLACLGSQIAGWPVVWGEVKAIGAGPARILARVPEDEYLKYVSYNDNSEEAVLCLQMAELPDEGLAAFVARACRVKPENLYLVVARNACLVTAVQVAARSIETTMYQMIRKGLDPRCVVYARGSAPIAPLVKDEIENMGRINDAFMYGGTVELWVEAEDRVLEEAVPRLTISANPGYGTPFGQLYQEAGCDFYRIHPDAHAVARVELRNIRSGKTFAAGQVEEDIVLSSFLGQGGKKC